MNCDLLSGLSQHLPQLVDRLTRNGGLPTEEDAGPVRSKAGTYLVIALMIEAMAYDTSALAFRQGSASDIIDQGVTGAV